MVDRAVGSAVRLLHARNAARTEPELIRCSGREWELLPGVFSPALDESTEIFCSMLLSRRFEAFLDIGCGAGVVGLTLALERGAEVTCSDISAAAVENTRRNADRHGLNSVAVLQGDLLEPVGEVHGASVFWNSAFIDAVPAVEDDLTNAFYDPGYRAHRRFFEQCGRRRRDIREVIVGFSSAGRLDALQEIADANHFDLFSRESRPSEKHTGLSYDMYTFQKEEKWQ